MSYRMILKGKYALFAPLLVLLLVAIACGDDAADVPGGLTAADVKSAVQEAVGDTVSAADISAMVTEAVSGIDIPEGVSAEDVGRLVSDAVSGIDVPEGVSAADIDKMVKEATAAAIAGAEAGVTTEQLAMAIDKAVTSAVKSAVSAAIPTAAAQPTATPVVAAGPRLANKLTVALNSFDNERMDPHVGAKNVGMFSFNHAQDYLIGVEVDNTLTNAWGWADSWEQIDGSTYDITIRTGLMDHDGVEMTSEDGVWNIHRLSTDPAAIGGFNVFSGSMTNIYESSEELDRYKFRINLVQDYAFMFNIIPPIGGSDGYFFPKHSWVDNGSNAQGWEDAGFGGTGFVDMTSRKLGVSSNFVRFDDYYGDEEFHFKYREMEILLAAEEAPRLALVQTGEVDIANMSGPYVEEIRAAGLTVDGAKGVDVVYLGIYQTFDEGFCTNNVNVRKAMNLAVDAEDIRTGIWPPGIVTPGITAFTSPQDESWNPTLTPYPYEPEEAKRILKDEGCENFRFDAYGYDFAAGPEMADMVDAIVTYLVAAGIDAQYTPIDWAANQQKVRNLAFSSENGPASGGAHWQLGGRNFADKVRVHGLCGPQGGSVCNLPNPEVWKERYLEYASIMDRDTRVARAQEMSKELYDLYVGVPIALRNAVWALDPKTICGDWLPIDGTPSHTMFNTLVPCESQLE